ncbi:hypothetical protein N7G274_004491 [Stereocaulon virgatum]|uniref:Cytochrome b mRNA-processing protein 4 n=1 Tax=Stereocaulon virgatum TaxID=373712 RepID=A0ABR4AA27_9LECA
MSKAGLWFKMLASGAIVMIGGPALVYYVSPTEEELFKRYNPELQKRSLENREQKQQDFDSFVSKLKEHSKSDKPIWAAAAEDEARIRANSMEEQRRIAAEIQKRRDEIKRHSISPD